MVNSIVWTHNSTLTRYCRVVCSAILYVLIAIVLSTTCLFADETLDDVMEEFLWLDFVPKAAEYVRKDHSGKMIPSIANLFTSSDLDTVFRAKFLLLCYGQKSVPTLVRFSEDHRRVKLHKTADTSYIDDQKNDPAPGIFVPYRLDLISVRAGWALEDLTFCDFEFSEPWQEQQADNCETEVSRRMAIRKVLAWFSCFGDWDRRSALHNALISRNKKRQMAALNWMRSPFAAPIEGCDDSYIEFTLKPIVETLASGTGEVKIQAQHVLDKIKEVGLQNSERNKAD